MATKPKNTIGVPNLAKVLGVRGHSAEVTRRLKAERTQREGAGQKILDPSDVSGDYDAKRALMTTLRGEPRPITLEDLRTFQQLTQRLGASYKGGITAQGVLDMSLLADRTRASEQIHIATIAQAKDGRARFVTNAGPESKVQRHYVHVEFPDYRAYAASPAKPEKLATEMLKGRIRFECDCERFRYWFRYIATKGNFVAGRAEPGFPKIRNPKLTGVACKHALRVMTVLLRDVHAKTVLAKMIENGQKFISGGVTLTAEQAKAAAAKQVEARRKGLVKAAIETTGEAQARRSASPAAKKRALQKAVKLAEKQAAEKAKNDQLRAVADKVKGALGGVDLTKTDVAALLRMLTERGG